MQNVSCREEVTQWRAEKEAELRRENSWLALAGLFWLKEGPNTIGNDAQQEVVLPAGPAHLGTITVSKKSLTLSVHDTAAGVTIDGKPATTAELRPDISGSPTYVTVGSLAFIIIQRGEAYAIRLWNNERPERQTFPGCKWLPYHEEFQVKGYYSRYEQAEIVQLERTLGDAVEIPAAGVVSFELQGEKLQLMALENTPNKLFLLFRDQTTGDTTYAAGRYLYADVQADGAVVLDFNRAYSPPCAVTPFATCMYPPRQNHLPVRIEAGELYEPFHLPEPTAV
jgi:uncharacterized protein (DUF1684 family)